MRLPHTIALALGFILIPCEAYAATVTENFSGTASLLSPGDFGDAGTSVFSMNVVQTQSLATISYDVSIQTTGGRVDAGGNGGLHYDTRGFGDTSGPSDALNSRWFERESFEVKIENLQVSAASGFDVVSHNIQVEFDSFDLVNHDSNAPTVFWLDDNFSFGFATATGNTSGAIETVSGFSSGATELDIYGYRRRMWINNIVTWFDGDVTITPDVTAVPEPNSIVPLLALGLFLRRKRRRRSVSA